MALDVYNIVNSWEYSAHNSSSAKQRRFFLLFPATDSLELVAKDVVGPLLTTTEESQRAIVITNCYTKPTLFSTTTR